MWVVTAFEMFSKSIGLVDEEAASGTFRMVSNKSCVADVDRPFEILLSKNWMLNLKECTTYDLRH